MEKVSEASFDLVTNEVDRAALTGLVESFEARARCVDPNNKTRNQFDAKVAKLVVAELVKAYQRTGEGSDDRRRAAGVVVASFKEFLPKLPTSISHDVCTLTNTMMPVPAPPPAPVNAAPSSGHADSGAPSDDADLAAALESVQALDPPSTLLDGLLDASAQGTIPGPALLQLIKEIRGGELRAGSFAACALICSLCTSLST